MARGIGWAVEVPAINLPPRFEIEDAIPAGLGPDDSELCGGGGPGIIVGGASIRIGRFEQANRGALSLDRLGDLPLELQHLIERSMIPTTGLVLNGPLPEVTCARRVSAAVATEDSESSYVLQALRRSDGVVGGPNGAAARLGLPRASSIAARERLGINPFRRHRRACLQESQQMSRAMESAISRLEKHNCLKF